MTADTIVSATDAFDLSVRAAEIQGIQVLSGPERNIAPTL